MTSQLRLSSMVQSFFTQHIPEHKQVSPRMVTAYRDTFQLLFSFLQNKTSRTPIEVEVQELDAPVILAFLDHLETARSNHARSHNARLSAIRWFFKYASVRDVEHLAIANRVLAMPNKRAARPMIPCLTRPEVDAILAAPNRETWLGSRDHDIAVIALWLGHESIETTHGYVEADLEANHRALDKLTPASGIVSRYKAGDSLLPFLAKL
jgi:integrase/recombinase XerD